MNEYVLRCGVVLYVQPGSALFNVLEDKDDFFFKQMKHLRKNNCR